MRSGTDSESVIRFQVNPEYQALLEANRLNRFSHFMNLTGSNLIESERFRDTQFLKIENSGFYLKRVRKEKLSSSLESYLSATLAHSKPYKEMLHYRFLQARGFDVATVVAVGEELRYALPRQGFIMTREVKGQLLSSVYQQSDDKSRMRISTRFGELLAKLHSSGFYGSTRLKDIVCALEADKELKLTLIDREVRNPYPRRITRSKITSRLLLNIRRQISQGEAFSEPEWREFARSYCATISSTCNINLQLLEQEISKMLR